MSWYEEKNYGSFESGRGIKSLLYNHLVQPYTLNNTIILRDNIAQEHTARKYGFCMLSWHAFTRFKEQKRNNNETQRLTKS